MLPFEQKVQALWDKVAIQDLRYHFAEALDNKDWTLLASLFTDEVETDWTAWGIPRQTMAKADLVAIFSGGAFGRPELVTEHLYTNFRITLSGDRAISVSNFLGQHYTADFAGGSEFYLRGSYTDELARTDQGWKIRRFTLRVFYATGNPNLLV